MTAVAETGTPPEQPDDGRVGISIDGRELRVPKGTLVLDAATEAGIHIPIYCAHPKMDPVAVCRMCLVNIEKFPKPQPACATVAGEGMVVRTDLPEVTKLREGMLEFLLLNHPLDCPVCDRGGECDLQDFTFRYGPGISRFPITEKVHFKKAVPLSRAHRARPGALHPLLALRSLLRRDHRREGDRAPAARRRHPGRHLRRSASCSRSSRATFPRSARSARSRTGSTASSRVRGTCSGPRASAPSARTAATSMSTAATSRCADSRRATTRWSTTCGSAIAAGTASTAGTASERVRRPVVRSDDESRDVSVPEAITQAARRLREIADEYGAASIGVLGSSASTNEELFLLERHRAPGDRHPARRPSARAVRRSLGRRARARHRRDRGVRRADRARRRARGAGAGAHAAAVQGRAQEGCTRHPVEQRRRSRRRGRRCRGGVADRSHRRRDQSRARGRGWRRRSRAVGSVRRLTITRGVNGRGAKDLGLLPNVGPGYAAARGARQERPPDPRRRLPRASCAAC